MEEALWALGTRAEPSPELQPQPLTKAAQPALLLCSASQALYLGSLPKTATVRLFYNCENYFQGENWDARVSFNVTIPPVQQQEAGRGSERIVPSWVTSEVGLSSQYYAALSLMLEWHTWTKMGWFPLKAFNSHVVPTEGAKAKTLPRSCFPDTNPGLTVLILLGSAAVTQSFH